MVDMRNTDKGSDNRVLFNLYSNSILLADWGVEGNGGTGVLTDLYFRTKTAAPIEFYTNNVERMRLTANGGLSLGSSYVGTDPGAGSMIISGNVGIGTTSPWELLSVNPNDISGPAFVIGSSSATLFKVSNMGSTTLFQIPSTVLTTDANGTIVGTSSLGVAYGGTGSTTLTGILLGNGVGSVNSYAGTSCTNQFIRSLNGAGAATCASVNLASGTDVTGTLTVANGGTGIASVADGALLFGGVGGGTANLVTLATTTNAGGFLSLAYTTGRPAWTATTSLFAGSAGQTLAFLNGAWIGAATTTLTNGSGITTTYSATNNQWTITNTGALFGFPFTLLDTFATSTAATTTSISTQGVFFASSTAAASQFPFASSTAFTVSGSAWFATDAGSKVGIGTTSPWGMLSINPNGITGPSFVIGSSSATNFIVTNGGNVGIGTTSPQSKLGILENFSETQTDFTQSLTKAGINIITSAYVENSYTPGIFLSTVEQYGTKPKAGIYTQNTNTGSKLFFGTSNSYITGITNDAMVIGQTGNVGIGTTSPWAKLSINNFSIGASATPLFTIASSTGTGATSTLFFVGANGNVGIRTASPNTPLDISGTSLGDVVDVTGEKVLSISRVSSVIFSPRANFSVGRWVDVTNRAKTALTLSLLDETSTHTDTDTDAMTWLSNGNVGIGTTSPSALLHLSSTDPKIFLTDTDTGADAVIGGSSGAGILLIGADENNKSANSIIALRIDGSALMTLEADSDLLMAATKASVGTAGIC